MAAAVMTVMIAVMIAVMTAAGSGWPWRRVEKARVCRGKRVGGGGACVRLRCTRRASAQDGHLQQDRAAVFQRLQSFAVVALGAREHATPNPLHERPRVTPSHVGTLELLDRPLYDRRLQV